MKKKLLVLALLCVVLLCTGCGSLNFTDKPSSDEGNSACQHSELKTLNAVGATCTETGLTEGKQCVKCGEIIEAQEIVAAKSHSFDDENDKVCNTCGFFNSDAPTFVVSEMKTSAGSRNVAITVSLKNNPGITSIVLSLNFDNEAMHLTKIEYNADIGGQTVYPQELESPVNLYWLAGFSDVECDWTFATLYFDVSSNATGVYDLQISYDLDNIFNISEENLNFKIVNGKIIIE